MCHRCTDTVRQALNEALDVRLANLRAARRANLPITDPDHPDHQPTEAP